MGTLDEIKALLLMHSESSLPGFEAQFTMAPYPRRNKGLANVHGKKCRDASVMILLGDHNNSPFVVLTVRPHALPHHAGQISFPGGRVEAGETKREAAMREVQEEIGLSADAFDVVSTLSPLFVPPSNFCVYPFVGVQSDPYNFVQSENEVDEIILAPLSHLLSAESRRFEKKRVNGLLVDVPYFDVDSHKIWGATAMMLAELLAMLPPETSELL